MKILKTIFGIISILSIIGCVSDFEAAQSIERQKELDRTRKMIINTCIDRGGIPILSKWDSTLLEDCKFSNEKLIREK